MSERSRGDHGGSHLELFVRFSGGKIRALRERTRRMRLPRQRERAERKQEESGGENEGDLEKEFLSENDK